MKRWSIALACAAALLALSVAMPARAETFRYVDREGREHILAVERATATASTSTGDATASGAVPLGAAFAESGLVADMAFPYADIVREAAAMYSLPVELIRAVMQVESGFDPRAVSWAGALGLMQLMPSTASDVGVVDPFDPRENVFGGARQLRILVNAFSGDVTLALAAYHAGAGAVRRSNAQPLGIVTRRYVAAVLALYRSFQTRALLASLPGPGRT